MAYSNPDVGSVSGSAFGESVSVTLPTGTNVASGPLPTVKLPQGGGGPLTNSVASVDQPDLLSTGTLVVRTQGAIGAGGFARTSAEVEDVAVLETVLTVDVVRSECESSEAGSTATTTLVGATLLGLPIGINPAPNTVINLPGIGTLTLNEQKGQTAYVNGKSNIIVNAVHLRLTDDLAGRGDIIISSSQCGVAPPPGHGTGGPLSGAAFGESVRVLLPVGTRIASGPLPNVKLPSTGGGPITRSAASVNQPDLLSTGALTVSTEGTVTPLFSHSFAEVAGVDVATGAITASLVRSECQSTPAGSTGTTTLVGARVLGAEIDANPAPNTTINLAGLGTLTLNEQSGSLTPQDGKTSITINAVHLRLNSPSKGAGDIIVASSHCDLRLS